MNLKTETLAALLEHGKTEQDIQWIGTREFRIEPALFWKLADQEYDSGYGAQIVNENLMIVGYNWWLERTEYDGSEWWEYKEQPKKPRMQYPDKIIFSEEMSE